MKVKQLIKELKKQDQEAQVIISNYDEVEGEHAFCIVKSVKEEYVAGTSGDSNDRKFIYLCQGEWV